MPGEATTSNSSVRRPICVVGLGYVGTVVAASIAATGRQVIGVDRRGDVVDSCNRGVAPISEPDLDARLQTARRLGTLRCTMDLAAAVAEAEATLVCVGTPLGGDGQLDEGELGSACREVALAVPADQSHIIVVRSTVPIGSYRRGVAQLLELLGDGADRVGLALNPEFLREGSAVADYEDPELIVYATDHEPAARFIEELHDDLRSRLVRTDPATAEMLKLVNNSWHALKVAFANEVARIAGPNEVNPFAVMELLCRDERLNISAKYLRPGLPFGGACLVKDVAAISSHAARVGADVPVLSSVLSSNRAHLEHLVEAILVHRPVRTAVVGLGFKPGAADVRNSAPVQLVRELLDRGVQVRVADSAVLGARVAPLGLDALSHALDDPRAQVAASVDEAIADADVIVVGHPCREDRIRLVAMRPGVPVLDCAGELTRHLTDEERDLLEPVVLVQH